MSVTGRRREDVLYGNLPEDIQPGDIWRYLTADGEPLKADCGLWTGDVAGNLTNEVWGYQSPDVDGHGLGIGTLVLHTVRTESDGTVSIRPGDGSSNSVLHTRRHWNGESHDEWTWHGYVEHCVWTSC